MKMHRRWSVRSVIVSAALCLGFAGEGAGPPRVQVTPPPAINLYVSARRGSDVNPGTEELPVATLARAVSLVPDIVYRTSTINVEAGTYVQAGSLYLAKTVRGRASIQIQARTAGFAAPARTGDVIFDWLGDPYLVEVTEGNWSLDNIQFGTRRNSGQGGGISVQGPARVSLASPRFRLMGTPFEGILAQDQGIIELSGTVEVNEDLFSTARPGTVSSVHAVRSGLIRFGSCDSLSIGNGQLGAKDFGVVSLACGIAKISSWTALPNFAAEFSSRLDVHGTPTHLYLHDSQGTGVFLNNDGHTLGEGATQYIYTTSNKQLPIYVAGQSAIGITEVFSGPQGRTLFVSGQSNVGMDCKGNLGMVRAEDGAFFIFSRDPNATLGTIERVHGARVLNFYSL